MDRKKILRIGAAVLMTFELVYLIFYTAQGLIDAFSLPENRVDSIAAAVVFILMTVMLAAALAVYLLKGGTGLAIFWQVMQLGVCVALLPTLIGIIGILVALICGWALVASRENF